MNQVVCSNCRGLNRAGAKFCNKCGNPFPPPPSILDDFESYGLGTGRLPAQSLLNNRYLVIAKVGQGGMGAVYKAADTHNQHQLRAVKEMSNSALTAPEDRQYAITQFRKEAELLQHLNHPNLPFVTDRFEIGDRHYLVMEFIDGSTLQKMLDDSDGPFPERLVNAWAAQLCDVLNYLHSQNPPIIFRDLKPDNIMITTDGRVKLIDFGIVRLFKPGKQKDTMAIGTLGYAAPEQHGSGQTDARSDVYSLGATMYCLLTSKEPVPYKPIPPVRKLNPAVSRETEELILRATSQDMGSRYPDTMDMKQAIDTGPLASGPAGGSTPVPGPSPSSGPKKTSRLTTRLLMKTAQFSPQQLAMASILIMLLIVAGAWFITPVIQGTWFWYNLPLISVVAPFAFAATRRRGAAAISQVVVALAGGFITWSRAGLDGNYTGLVLGALLSAVAIEIVIALLPKIMGSLQPDDPGAWQREAAWLGIAAAVGYVILTGLSFNFAAALQVIPIVSAFILGGVGWFFGDLLQGFMFMKQTGSKRR